MANPWRGRKKHIRSDQLQTLTQHVCYTFVKYEHIIHFSGKIQSMWYWKDFKQLNLFQAFDDLQAYYIQISSSFFLSMATEFSALKWMAS